MKQVSNKDLLNAIRNEASEEYKANIPAVDGRSIDTAGIWKKFEGYPSLKNEFLQTLATKVVKSEFFSKVFENPLKMLKKGVMPYGHTMEELFVEAAKAKGFFKSNNKYLNDVDELIGVEEAKIHRAYISRNFAYVFKTSISDAQLKSAFTSQNGLSELVNQIVGSLTSGAEQQEYLDVRDTLFAVATGKKITMIGDNESITGNVEAGKHKDWDAGTNIATETEGSDPMSGARQYMYVKPVCTKAEYTANKKDVYEKLSITIRELAGQLRFPSEDYNMAKVTTWSRPEDLIFITTPKIMANMDVAFLANAFNVSMADIKTRTILVDKLPDKIMVKGTKAGTINEGSQTLLGDSGVAAQRTDGSSQSVVLGFLIDKDFLQIHDTLNESRTFDNGRNLTQNLFLHKQGMLANCYFANAITLAAVN